MPVEIRELHIKINVNEQTQDNNNTTSGTENNRQETRKNTQIHSTFFNVQT